MTAVGIDQFVIVFLMFAVILFAAMLSSVVERFGQPLVVGQLLAGVVLSALGYFGWQLMRDAASNPIVAFLAAFGAIILLLSAGMESNLKSISKVGLNATLVAIIGVSLPFFAGVYLIGPLLFPGQGLQAYLFIGATLVATSVGISVAIFKALGITRSRAAQTVLAAALFDDILGLVVLAVVSEIALHGNVTYETIGLLVLKPLIFLFGALAIGQLLAPFVARQMSRFSRIATTKLVLALVLALGLGYVAYLIGLQPIIGAFAAGLLLSGMDFGSYDDPDVVDDLIVLRDGSSEGERGRINHLISKYRRSHLGGMVDTVGAISVPVFFVYTGLQIDFGSLLNPQIYILAVVIAALAIIGKVLSGAGAKGPLREKLVVGIAMVPRGEVGLIFAATAVSLGVFSRTLYSTMVLVIIITTFIAPPILVRLLKKHHLPLV